MKLNRLLALSAAVLGTTTAAHAQTVSPQPAPTIITTAPYTISAPGYYQLGANLTVTNTTGNIITIAAGNVTLDFAGHYISGPSDAASIASSTLYGIGSVEHGNLKVINGTIAYCYEGINFYGNSSATTVNVNQLAQNMLVTYISHIGINFQGTRYSRALDCVVSNIGGVNAANGTSNYAFYNTGIGTDWERNIVSTVAGGNSQSGFGFYGAGGSSTLAVGNKAFNCDVGLANITKYEDTLTSGCTTAFSGGTSVGSNN